MKQPVIQAAVIQAAVIQAAVIQAAVIQRAVHGLRSTFIALTVVRRSRPLVESLPYLGLHSNSRSSAGGS